MALMLTRLHFQGIHPSIKGEVWEFLLGAYDPDSTFEERNKLRNHRRYLLNAYWCIVSALDIALRS